jgi:hypothetical protein
MGVFKAEIPMVPKGLPYSPSLHGHYPLPLLLGVPWLMLGWLFAPWRQAVNTNLLPDRFPCFTWHATIHSVTKHLSRFVIASMLAAQGKRLPSSLLSVTKSGLRLKSPGLSLRSAESNSSSYGLHVRLRYLPTPFPDDAVTFEYRERAPLGRGLASFGSRLLPGERIPAGSSAGMTIRDQYGYFVYRKLFKTYYMKNSIYLT